MKPHIYIQADYNLWANRKTTELLASLDPSVIDQPIANSFATIKETLKHLHYAEVNWLKRIQLDEHTQIPWIEEDTTPEKLYKDMIRGSQDLIDFVHVLDEEGLAKPIDFVSGEGTRLTHTLEQIIYHVINHSTYHRGQVITMLKQLGIKEAVSTDLYFYYQEI